MTDINTEQAVLAGKLIALRHNLLELPQKRHEINLQIESFLERLRRHENHTQYQAWHILRGSALANIPASHFDFPGELSVERFLFSLGSFYGLRA